MNKILGWLAAAAAFALTLFAALMGAKREGRKEEKLKQIELEMKQSRQADEIRARNRDASDDDIRRRLRKYERK